MSGDEDNTRSLQQETSETSSLLDQLPATNILVVDSNFTTLLNMKKTMRQYDYQVTIEADAERALAFLISCKHEINILIWDFHMPGINGLQALKIIGSTMDIPVVIMSDDNQTESVMKATIYGACDYVMKPVKEGVLANIWQHIVRKRMMSKPNLTPPVQSDLPQSNGLCKDKADSKIVDQEQNIDKKEENATKRTLKTLTRGINLVQSDLIQTEDLDQRNNYSKTINQDDDDGEQNIHKKEGKKPRMTRPEDTQLVHSNLVQSNVLDQDNDDFKNINQGNDEKKIEKKFQRKARKLRMTWTGDLHQKFLIAIEIVGGIEKANPKLLLECLRDMKVEGLTNKNVSSHLQKHRINLEEKQNFQETGWPSAYRPTHRPTPFLQGSDNVHTAISSYHMNGQAETPIQHNQYGNDYMTMDKNHFKTNHLPRVLYFENHLHQPQQQQEQSAEQLNYLMSKKESEQASGISATNLEPTYPSLLYHNNL